MGLGLGLGFALSLSYTGYRRSTTWIYQIHLLQDSHFHLKYHAPDGRQEETTATGIKPASLSRFSVFQLFVRQFKYCILALFSLQNVPVHVPVSLILEVLKHTEN